MMQPLRIGVVAPIYYPVPPDRYGGTERVIHALAEELVARGHRVTLFAAGTSRTSAHLVESAPLPIESLDPFDSLVYQVLQVVQLREHSAELDIIHSHAGYLPWLAGGHLRAPMVTTVHGPLDSQETRHVLSAFPEQPLVAISDSQRFNIADLPLKWMATVHNGLPLAQLFSFGPSPGDYLVHIGRIARDKGTHLAIRVARRAGLDLKIAGPVHAADRAYHEAEVAPYLDGRRVEWLGELTDHEKAELLRHAAAVLLPLQWPEPFGLVAIESLACGTPVVATPCGAMPELVRHGVHGYLAATEDELVEGCRLVHRLDRHACRRWALERFSQQRMTGGYEEVYLRLLGVTRVKMKGLPEPIIVPLPEEG